MVMRLTDFGVMTFDCYGTLIDWESGILTALRPLVARSNVQLTDDAVLAAFGRHETSLEAAQPATHYRDVLALVHDSLAREWGVAPDAAESRRFGASVGEWPEFADTVASLDYLRQHYKLTVLSNVDRQSFGATSKRLGAMFDAVYTAEDIGSYKPDPRNFAYLASAWIDRRHGRTGWGATAAPRDDVRYDFRFTSLAEMVVAHRQALRGG
jgi:2-haloalkanoic acid dehalogenase type II